MRWFSFGRRSGKTSEILKRYQEHGGQLMDPKAAPHTDAPGAYQITDNSSSRATYSTTEYQPWIELVNRPYPYPIVSTCSNMRKSDAQKQCGGKPVVWQLKSRTRGDAYCKECILLYWRDCEQRGDTPAIFYDSDGNRISRL
jgi:hypothetical protein